MFSIPPRSPDLNPIENLFHLISKKLENDALDLQIQSENFEQFSKRVRDTMMDYPKTTIDNIIKSMGKRITMIIKKQGERLKY